MSFPVCASPDDPAPITVTIPGLADTSISENSLFDTEPELRAAYRQNWTRIRRGKGYSARITLSPASMQRLADWLWAKEGALDAAVGDTGDGYDRRERDAVRKALATITTALEAAR